MGQRYREWLAGDRGSTPAGATPPLDPADPATLRHLSR